MFYVLVISFIVIIFILDHVLTFIIQYCCFMEMWEHLYFEWLATQPSLMLHAVKELD